MIKIIHKITNLMFNFLSKVKISNIHELLSELTKALKDGKITEEEKAKIIEKAEKVIYELEKKK